MIDLPNRTLRIGVVDDRPFTSSCSFDPVCPYRGSGVEMARIARQILNLNCIFVPFGSYTYGTVLENGTVTGIVGAVQRGEFDTHLPNLMPTSARQQVIDFSEGYYYADSILVTRASTVKADLGWSVVYAFHWRVWCLFAFALISTAAFITFTVHETVFNTIGKFKKPLRFTGYVLETSVRLALVNEHRKSFSKHRPTVILSLFWGYSIVVLASAYSGLLFSKKIVNDGSAPFTDFESFIACVEKGRCVVVTPLLSVSYILYLTSPGSPHAARFEKAFVKNPIKVISKDQIPQRILEEESVFLTWVTAKNELPGYIDDKARCSYLIVPTPETTIGAFPVRKGAKELRKALDIVASTVRQVGLQFAVGLEPVDKPCTSSLTSYEAVHANNQKMNFEKSLRIPFYFFISGLGGSTLLFLAE